MTGQFDLDDSALHQVPAPGLQPEPAGRSRPTAADGHRLNILLVERESFFRGVIAAYLSNGFPGADIIFATSFSAAIEEADRVTRPDLIVANLQSASSRGLADVNALYRTYGKTPIILLSHDLDCEHLIDAYRCGVAGIVFRTMQARILLLAVEVIISGELYLPSVMLSALGLVDNSKSQSSPLDPHSRSWTDLTKREREILRHLCDGRSNKEVAELVGISLSTARHHINNIFRKFNVNNRVAAVQVANQLGISKDPATGHGRREGDA